MRKWLFPAAVLLLAGCDVMNGPDLRAKAQQDVQLARASEYHLTIAADAGGSTVPSGSLIAKEGFSVDIEGTAQPETVLVGWKQTAGAGKVKFTPVTTTKMNVAVSGGDATIAPVYLSRPSVLYMLPGGNTVAKNVSVRIVFDQNVDHAGAAALVALKDQNSTPVAFDDKSVSHSNSIVLKPQANLANYGTYIIYALAGVPLDVDFNSSFFDGVTFLNQTVTSRSQTANSFTTGSQIDNTPPTSSSFNIASLTGDAVYTAGVNVNLKAIDATDDSGPGGVDRMQIYNTTIHGVSNLAGVPVTAAINSGAFSLAFTSGMNYAWSLGSAIEGKYTVSALFQDQSLNAQAYVAYPGAGYTAYRDIYLDLTAPTVSALTFGSAASTTIYFNSGTSKTYISGLSTAYSMTAADPNLANTGSTFKGSGESSDGSNSVERKQYQLSNDGVNYSAWLPYTATGTWTLAAGADGSRTVSVRVADSVGNASSAFTTTTQLVVDTTAPSVTIAGASGTLYTTTGTLPLSVTSTETGSGLNTYVLTNPTDGRAAGFVSDGTVTAYGGTSGSPYTITATVKTGTPGARSFDVKIADKVGNTAIVPINAVYDNLIPVTNLATNPFVQSVTVAKPTNSSNLTVNLAPSDADSGMAYVYWAIVNGDVAVSGATPASLGATKVAVPASGAYTMPVSWTPAGISETKTLFLWFEDKAGNLTPQTRPTQRINYSNDAPLGTVVVPTPSVPKNGAFTVTWSGTATSINITKAELSNDGSAWRNVSSNLLTSGIGSTSISSIAPLSFDPTEPKYGGSTTNGPRLVYLRLTGSNGNTSVVTASYTYDNTPPYVTSFAVTGSGGTVTTNNATVTVSFWLWDNITAWAAGAGITTNTYEFSINGGAYTAPVAETTYANSVSYVLTGVSNNSIATVSLRGTDQAGNTTIVTQNILYDIVAPAGGTMTSPGTVSDRVVTITGNPTDGESGVDQVETWSDGNYSGWRTYTPAVAFLLTPQNGTKTLYVHYKDKAGNQSGWVGPTYVTLNSNYSNLYNSATNWGNIVGANYADPSNRAGVQNTSYISLTSLNMTSGLQGPRSYVYKTNAGQYGWFDYYLSGTTIQFYYQTYNSSGSPYVTNWTYGSISLPAAGDYVYIDLDNSTWSAVKNTFPASPTNYDFYIQNQAGVLNLVRYQPMLLAPF